MINKKTIEEILGYEIDSYIIDSNFSNEKCNGLRISIQPKTHVEYIEIKFNLVSKTDV